MFDLRMGIYGHLQRLDLRYFDRNPVGRLMTRVTSDVDVLNDLFTSGVVTAFGDVFKLVGIMDSADSLEDNYTVAVFPPALPQTPLAFASLSPQAVDQRTQLWSELLTQRRRRIPAR